MKKLSILLGFCLIIFTNFIFAQVKFDKELFEKLSNNKNKIPNIAIPQYKKFTLKNGMNIYLIEDNKLPIVQVSGYILGGYSQETTENTGISEFMLSMMNTGTKNLNDMQFAEFKGLYGIDLSFSARRDIFYFSGNALSIDKEKLIYLLAEILTNPDFEAPYFQRVFQDQFMGYQQAFYMDESLINMNFYKKIYRDHPYSFKYDYKLKLDTIKKITPEALKNFYAKYIIPNNTYLVISGDFNSNEMIKNIEKEFSKWEKKDTKLFDKKINVSEITNRKKITIINKPDATQAKLMLGFAEPIFDNNFVDETPLFMANKIYGGGDFSCRLIENLRTNKGLVYSAYSDIVYTKLGGNFEISTEVKPESALEAINGIFEEVDNIINNTKPISKTELEKSINFYNGLLPKNYTNKHNLVANEIYIKEIIKNNNKCLNNFITAYNNLKFDSVQATFKKYINPEKFQIVILGKKELLLPQFENKGYEIEVIE